MQQDLWKIFFQLDEGVDDVNVVNFLPVLMDEYFHYHGSLTTGGCEESVNWVVFKNPLAIKVTRGEGIELNLDWSLFVFCRSLTSELSSHFSIEMEKISPRTSDKLSWSMIGWETLYNSSQYNLYIKGRSTITG